MAMTPRGLRRLDEGARLLEDQERRRTAALARRDLETAVGRVNELQRELGRTRNEAALAGIAARIGAQAHELERAALELTWRIDFADEAQRTHDEHLTISVGRDTAKEARDALAWFQLGQSEPVTIDVEEGCLAVHLDDGILSIGVEGTEDATVWYKPHGEEGYEFGAVIPAGFGLDEEEQVEFYEIIDGLMGNLAGFHYLAGGAAVRAIVASTIEPRRYGR